MTCISFPLDMNKIFQLCVYLVVLSIFIERALALVFGHRWFIQNNNLHGKKEFITFLVSLLICWNWNFDAFSVLNNTGVTQWGVILSAMILGGGTKGWMKLMQDVLGIKRTPEEIQKIMDEKKPTPGA